MGFLYKLRIDLGKNRSGDARGNTRIGPTKKKLASTKCPLQSSSKGSEANSQVSAKIKVVRGWRVKTRRLVKEKTACTLKKVSCPVQTGPAVLTCHVVCPLSSSVGSVL